MGTAATVRTDAVRAMPGEAGAGTPTATTIAAPQDLAACLRAHYGPQSWWPGAPPAIMYTAVLVQHSTWTAASRALVQLRAAGLMSPAALATAHPQVVEASVRPAGGFRRKARTLRDLAGVIVRETDGDVHAFLRQPLASLRERLRAVHGIGPETADAICLFAARRPVFIVDAYTRRIVGRLAGTGGGAPDALIRQALTTGLPRRASVYGELHALLVTHGRAHCRPEPRCGGCPLRSCCVRGQADAAGCAPAPKPALRDWPTPAWQDWNGKTRGG